MRADAPAVKMQKTNSSHRRSSVALRPTSSNSLRRDCISRRRARWAARIFSTVTGSRSRRKAPTLFFKREVVRNESEFYGRAFGLVKRKFSARRTGADILQIGNAG